MATVHNLYATVPMTIPGGRIELGDLLTIVSDDPANPGAVIIEHARTHYRFSQQAVTIAHSYAVPIPKTPHRQ